MSEVSEESVAALQLQLETLEAKLKQKEHQLDQTLGQCRQLTQDKDELISSTEVLEHQLASLNQKEMKLEAKHRREVERLTVDLDGERSRAAILEEDVGLAKAAVQSLKEEVSAAERKADDSNFDTKNAFAAHQDGEGEEGDELRAALEDLQLKNRRLQNETRELEEKLSYTKKQASEAAEERTKAIETLVEKNEALHQAEAQLVVAEQRILDMEMENEDLKDELADMSGDGNNQTKAGSDDGGRGAPALNLTLNSDFTQRLGRERAVSTIGRSTSNMSFSINHDGEDTSNAPYHKMEESTSTLLYPSGELTPRGVNSEGSDDPKPRKKESGCPCIIQ